MKIGIPRAFLYYTYRHLWETFFTELGCEIVLSPETNKQILKDGISYAIDESCLSSKIYMGHVYSLIGECDYILIPRIANFGDKEIVCSKFQAIYDVVSNTFKEEKIKILDYNIDVKKKKTEFQAFMQMGKDLKKKKFDVLRAYFMAKQAEKTYDQIELKKQEELLKNKEKLKILLVSHSYNIYDKLIGEPILNYLEELDCIPIIANVLPRAEAKVKAKQASPTLPWTYNKELYGAIELYKDKVDGIILMTSFPCGPDSLVNEVIIRRTKDKPIINLILDGQEGTAGVETRLESFIDIIRIKRGGLNEEKKES
jgi:predicted nucleotide-binding protein (sugar kinase/HSP70/actin superfamily)